ncbi:TetR/AcrR family transcriptional regulator [Companilactobacillus formosensis]|uniref:TetR/AcrR family transcriptional regulator n=1 Tax=Companilactobacillus formosensis TaxID=1617889 RepID=UPI000E652E56|nr:TetR/AcrR family transcriptional regulator [Companilactobacillus formosensis]
MTNNLKRKKDKRQTILDAATKVFLEKGYKKTSIANIAKEAKASQVTLYKYFPSKVALGRAVIIKLIIDGYSEYDKLLDNDAQSFVEKMKVMMSNSSSLADGINDDFVVFLQKEFSGQNGDTSVVKVYNQYKRNFWFKLLDQGRQEGVISDEVTNEGAMIFLDLFINYSMNAKENGVVALKNHEKDIIHLFFYGIMGR